jgi:hypothetical protein
VFDGIELPTGRGFSAQQTASSDSASFSQHQKSQLSEQDTDMRIENGSYLPSRSRNSGTKSRARRNSPKGSRAIQGRKNILPSDLEIVSTQSIAEGDRESSLSEGT